MSRQPDCTEPTECAGRDALKTLPRQGLIGPGPPIVTIELDLALDEEMSMAIRVATVGAMALAVPVMSCRGLEGADEGVEADTAAGRDGASDGVDPQLIPVDTLPVSGVVISEIMYHPAHEQADVENHEFVELHNRGSRDVALGGWTISSKQGVAFTFPSDARLSPGEYAVVAKNKQMLTGVYMLASSKVFGDYQGELGNRKDTVILADGSGKPVDAVAYGDSFPWPMSADALGVGDDWLPPDKSLSTHKYKGCSLERISLDGPPGSSSWPANWESSPIDGATPGMANRSAGAMLPIVEECSTCPGGAGLILRSGQPAKIRARFSSFASVSDVELEYFVDDLVKAGIPTKLLPMAMEADGGYSVTLPDALKDNDMVRY